MLLIVNHKKVFLRERKRHTAHRVVSTPSVVLTRGVPHPRSRSRLGGYPILGPGPDRGVHHPRSRWSLARGYPIPGWGTPIQTWPGYPPSRPGQTTQGTPHLDLAGLPPPLDLARAPPVWTWLGYPLSGPGQGTHPYLHLARVSTCGQTDGWMDRHVSKHYLPVVLRTPAVINRSNSITHRTLFIRHKKPTSVLQYS